MKLVEITARRVSIEGKMYGKPGQFPFSDRIAKQLVRNREGKIVKDLGADDDFDKGGSEQAKEEELLSFVEKNKHAILAILDSAYQEQERGAVLISDREKQENVENSNATNASSQPTEDDQGQTSNAPGDQESEGEGEGQTGSENSQEGEQSEGTPLPERFPSKDKLEEAGFTTLESIPRNKEKLAEAGLSERSVNAIAVRLEELDKEGQ